MIMKVITLEILCNHNFFQVLLKFHPFKKASPVVSSIGPWNQRDQG